MSRTEPPLWRRHDILPLKRGWSAFLGLQSGILKVFGRSSRGDAGLKQEQLALFGLEEQKGLPAFISDFVFFLRQLPSFILRKVRLLFFLPVKIICLAVELVAAAKAHLIRKLVWGRGRLFVPATRIGVSVLTLVVFVLGGTGWARSKNLIAPFGQERDILAKVDAAAPITYTNNPSGDPITYVVKAGDTLSTIGEQFKVGIASIRYANNLANVDYIKPGQELTIPPVSGVLHTVKKGDTVKGLAQKYSVPPQSIVDFNYLFAPFKLVPGGVLVIPGGIIPQPKVEPRYYAAGGETQVPLESLGTGQFVWPTNRRQVSQYFSRWHPAIDISKFSPVYSIDSGTVTEVRYSGWNYGYGKLVRIDHGNGYKSLFAHLSSVSVRPGQKVSRGQVLGVMGNTGRSYGTHLHLEITFKGRHINPLSVL